MDTEQDCPFDRSLARTAYLVIPKMALQAMPMDWRLRMEALLQEAEDAGLVTPDYIVLRDEVPYAWRVREDPEDERSPTDHVVVYRADPWADYRRHSQGNAHDLCPTFKLSEKPDDA